MLVRYVEGVVESMLEERDKVGRSIVSIDKRFQRRGIQFY